MPPESHQNEQVQENTSFVVDLDLGTGNPDLGTDVCVERENLRNQGIDASKPVSYTLTLGAELTTDANTSQSVDKFDVGSILANDDGDGSFFIRVSNDSNPNDTSLVFFEGTVFAGESFTASASNAGVSSFGSETYVHIFDDDGTLLQTINFHTSCSAPLVIGDQFGSVALSGATLSDNDTGTLIEFGGSSSPSDEGVVYSIVGGPDAALFEVDPDTGEVSFIDPPDFENPKDSGGDNKYDVIVRATREDSTFVDTALEVCVEDDCIRVQENTSFVVDLDLGTGNPDLGTDVCVERENLRNQGIDASKPVSYTLTLGAELTTDANTSQSVDKFDVGSILANDDGDGSFFIRVSNDSNPNDTSLVFFEGTVFAGESFTASASNAGVSSFGSETYVHIFDDDGTLLQTINFHTSCSAPLVIGDQFGSVALSGATLSDNDTGTLIEFGGSSSPSDEGVVYSIVGGPDAALFEVDPDTGEVSFIDPPDFENPKDSGGDNKYDVIVRATREDSTFVDTALEVCVEDDKEPGSLSGRYFCDTNDNDQDDGNGNEPGIGGVLVELLDGNGLATGVSTVTDSNGQYMISGLEAGTYGVRFTDPDGVLDGKVLVEPNAGDDASDSDAIGDTTLSVIPGIVVVAGQNTSDNDAGAEYALGSISGRYFCDTDFDNLEGLSDLAVAGKTVTLLGSDGTTVIATTTTGGDGMYSFEGLLPGDYVVMFEDSFSEGKNFVLPDVGSDDAIDSDVIDTIGGKTASISVAAGENISDVDAGVAFWTFDFEKDISNIVAYLDCDGASSEEITKIQFEFEFDFELRSINISQVQEALALQGFGDCGLLGLTIKAGNNKGDFGRGEGQFFDANPTDDFVDGTRDKADFEFFVDDYFSFA